MENFFFHQNSEPAEKYQNISPKKKKSTRTFCGVQIALIPLPIFQVYRISDDVHEVPKTVGATS
jgi:hypothetical protein